MPSTPHKKQIVYLRLVLARVQTTWLHLILPDLVTLLSSAHKHPKLVVMKFADKNVGEGGAGA